MSDSLEDSVVWDVDGQKQGSVGIPLGDVVQTLATSEYRLPLPVMLELPAGLPIDDLGALSTKTPPPIAATIAQKRMALVTQHPEWASLRLHFLTPDQTVVGSDPKSCDVILQGGGISNRHATLLGSGADWHVITYGDADCSLEGVTLEAMAPANLTTGQLLGFASYGLLFLHPTQIHALANDLLNSQAASPADSSLGTGAFAPGFAPTPAGIAFSDVLFAAEEPGFLESWQTPCFLQVPVEGTPADPAPMPGGTQRISRDSLKELRTSRKVGTTRLHPLAFAEGQTELVLGRDPRCDVILDEGTVSKQHAKLTLGAGGEWFLSDAGSTNGTFVKGTRLPPEMPFLLRGGEKLWFASYWALFLLPEQFQRMVARSLR